jgi:hypothetical protein
MSVWDKEETALGISQKCYGFSPTLENRCGEASKLKGLLWARLNG